MKKQTENKQSEKKELSEKSQSSRLPSGATVKSSSAEEKIKAFNVGNSPNIAHVSETKAKNINVVSATFNQGNLTPDTSIPLNSSAPSPIASVSNTTVTGDLHVSSTVTNIQPVASVTNTQVTGDLYVKSTVKTVYQMGPDWPLAEKKFDREIPPPLKALCDAYQMRCQNSELTQALAYYVLSEATHLLGSEKRFDLETEVKQFLTDDGASPLLLIQGDSGSGKSLYANLLEQQLWQAYDPKQTNSYIPIFIELKSIESSAPKNFIQQFLKKQYGYTVQQIQQLRDQLHFMFILDGYDEMGGEVRSIYLDNELNKWRAKVIVTCRTQYLNNLANYQYLFSTQNQNVSLSFKELFVAPFSTSQIENYLKIYTAKQKIEWDVKTYLDKLNALTGVRDFIQSPLLLKIVIEILPELEKLQKNNHPITRADIYGLFIRKWFERENLRATFKSPDPYGLFGEFSEQLAFQMFLQGVIEVNYQSSERDQKKIEGWEKFFSSKNPEIIRKRAGCPLRRIGENLYSFYHKSFMEYFCAMHLYEEWGLGEKDELQFKKMLSNLVNTDLNKKLLTQEPAIIEFLSEKIKDNETAIERLLSIVIASKKNPAVINAAGNAITIAKVACLPRSPFSGKDFSYVQIEGADLSYGIYDHTNFSYANLRHVNFTQAWLGNANLSYCQMQNVQFGERPYLEFKNEIRALAYNYKAQCLAVVCDHYKIELWDIVTNKQLRILSSQSIITSISFSPDGRTLASGDWNKIVKLWDVKSGTSRVLLGHSKTVTCVNFSPDGLYLASASEDCTIRIWDIQSGTSRVLEGHKVAINCISFNPNGKILASTSKDKTVLWDIENNTSRILPDKFALTHVASLSFSLDGRILALANLGKILLYDMQNDTTRVLGEHGGELISCIYFNLDGTLVSGGQDKTLRVWDVKSATSTIWEGHVAEITSITFNQDEQILISGSKDKTVRLWDMQSCAYRISQKHTRENFENLCLCFAPDGKTLLLGGYEGIRLKDIGNNTYSSLSGLPQAIRVSCLKFSHNGKILAYGDGGKVRLWNKQDGTVHTLEVLEGSHPTIHKIDFHPDGLTLASVSYHEPVRLWDIKTKTCRILNNNETEITSINFSPNGEILALGTKNGKVLMHDMKGDKTHVLNHNAEVIYINFSSNGKVLTSGSRYSIWLWELESGKCRTLQLSQKPTDTFITCIKISPNGNLLATGASDCTLRLWEVKSGRCFFVSKGYLDAISEIHFYDDNNFATACKKGGAVKLWQQVEKTWQLQSSNSPMLFCENCYIGGVQGLSALNYQLLNQRGAVTSLLQKTQDFFAYYPSSFFGASKKNVEVRKEADATEKQMQPRIVLPTSQMIIDDGIKPLDELVLIIQQSIGARSIKINRSLNDIGWLLLALEANPSITEVDLQSCEIRDEQANILASWLKTNKTIKKINLSNNEIDGGAVELVEAVYQNLHIQEINLKSNPCGIYSHFRALRLFNDIASDKRRNFQLIIENWAERWQEIQLRSNGEDLSRRLSLSLERNTFSSEAVAEIKHLLNYVPLEYISLFEINDLTGLVECLKKNGTVKTLRLSRCDLGKSACQLLIELLNITKLDIYKCRFDINVLAIALENNTSLKILILSGHQISDDEISVLAKVIAKHSALEELHLWGNRIGPVGVKKLLSALQNCLKIQLLDLSLNSLGEEGGKLIADFLESDSSLKKLNLENSQLGDGSITAIGRALEKNTSLEFLSLAKNKNISEKAMLTLLEELQKNQTLLTLEMPHEQISESYKKDFEKLLERNRIKSMKREPKENITLFEDKSETDKESGFKP